MGGRQEARGINWNNKGSKWIERVTDWDRLLKEIVQSLSLEIYLDKTLTSWLTLFEEQVKLETSRVPFQPELFFDKKKPYRSYFHTCFKDH